MNCKKAIEMMHDYLDDINKKCSNELQRHQEYCKSCKSIFEELKMTDKKLKNKVNEELTCDFVDNIIKEISGKKRTQKINIFSRKYPAIFAASIFLILFSISLISYIIPDDELKIVSENQQDLIVSGSEVIIPVGEEIEGDILIENGDLNIQGAVSGNVTVVNGELLLASVDNIDGNTNQIDRFFEILWYRIKNLW